MYILPEMIDLSNFEWVSSDHKTVAENCLLCNPNITNLDDLTLGCEIINKISSEQISKVTIEDLIKLGVPGF